MKVEGRLFASGVVFYTIVAIAYWLLSHEPAGTTALALTAGLAALISFYLVVTGRRIGLRPEDRVDGEIDEATGELGFFSPHSWWPLMVAGGGAIVALGIVFGFWLLFIGVVVLGFAVIGLVFEYYRGAHAH